MRYDARSGTVPAPLDYALRFQVERALDPDPMTDNKPKIDLKSRLGKKTVSSPSGASIPPPVGIPRPSGIPAPPFGSRPASAIDASNPYASVEASQAPARIEPQAIKIEMSEEVRQEQKKQGRKFIFVAIGTALVGGVLGFTIGGGYERGKVADQALRDAGELAKQVKEAMGTAETLADTLKAAREQLSSGKYPEAEVTKLGGIRIPFGGDKLGGRNIGRFKKEVSGGLLSLTSTAEKINEQTETVQRILSGTRKGLTDLFQQGATPKVMWAAYAEAGPTGPVLTMLNVPEPFLLKAEKDKPWPESIKFKIGGKDVSVKRYTKGDPAGSDPLFIPVDPGSQGAVCAQDLVFRVARQVQELESLLRGGKDESGQDEAGFMDAGRALEEKLKAIGTPN